MPLTDQEVETQYDMQGAYAYPFSKICVRCGEAWVRHTGICCPNASTTFLPREDYPTNGCDGCGSSCDGCKSSSESEEPKDDIPEWKKLRDATRQPGHCPCGIAREDCWIHR